MSWVMIALKYALYVPSPNFISPFVRKTSRININIVCTVGLIPRNSKILLKKTDIRSELSAVIFVFDRTGTKSAIPNPSVNPDQKVRKISPKSLMPVYSQ
jgi:hypothetical protein